MNKECNTCFRNDSYGVSTLCPHCHNYDHWTGKLEENEPAEEEVKGIEEIPPGVCISSHNGCIVEAFRSTLNELIVAVNKLMREVKNK